MRVLKSMFVLALALSTLASFGSGAVAGPGGGGGGGGHYGPHGMCGGIAGFQCPSGQYCDMGPGRPYPDQAGTCRPNRQRACPRIYRPVCGVDRRTYPNACEAARRAVRVRHPGAC